MEFVKYTEQNHIGCLTVDRPKALNALNSQVLDELLKAIDDIAAGAARVLIVTGGGEKAFVAGADIGEMREMTPSQAEAFCRRGNAVMRGIETLAVPVIAAVNGYALGGGCELALCCDIRLASESAVFGFPEVTLGVLPGYGGLQRLARAVGLSRAGILAFTGERFKADRALEMGLVDRVCEQGALMEQAYQLAGKIAQNAPIAVRGIKKVLKDSIGLTLSEADCAEAEAFAGCFGTEDQLNAMGAFLKLNEPRPFTGR
ncbi:MAG: enoyl-CoA hydratase/isomerase family protein [Oscillospiraceae bacterium]|jgi:enoyl-CoA hydratase|nr:enoyl-CoA hydratase/isomerase family protein [Oscillospiraceae bacterium]